MTDTRQPGRISGTEQVIDADLIADLPRQLAIREMIAAQSNDLPPRTVLNVTWIFGAEEDTPRARGKDDVG